MRSGGREAYLTAEGFNIIDNPAPVVNADPLVVEDSEMALSVLHLNDTAGCLWSVVLNAVTPLLWVLECTYLPDTVDAEVFEELGMVGVPEAVMGQLVRSLNTIRTPEPELVGAEL